MSSALLIYEKLVSYRKSIGIIIYPYDPCVSNMIVNEKHITITWNVNNLKMLHIDADEVKN